MKLPIIATTIALVFSGPALAADTNSHTAHHPGTAQPAGQGPTQAPAPAARPDQTSPSTRMNCPMMANGQTNMTQGSMMGAPTGATAKSCPMMKGASQKAQQHPPHTMTLHQNTN